MSFLGSASKCLEYLEVFQISACFTSYSFRSNLPAWLMKDSCLKHPVSLKTWGISALHNKLEFKNEFILPFGLHTHTKKKTAFMTQRVIKQTFVGCICFTPWVGAAGRCNTPAATLSISFMHLEPHIFPIQLGKKLLKLSQDGKRSISQIGCWRTSTIFGLRSGLWQYASDHSLVGR